MLKLTTSLLASRADLNKLMQKALGAVFRQKRRGEPLLLLFYIMWIIFNARITVEVCLLGLPAAAVLYVFMIRFTNYSLKRELRFMRRTGYLVAYIFILIAEIIKANVKVIAIILDKNIPIKQTVVCFDTDLKSNLAKVILANSITLTPGTITVSVDGQKYTVHCLSREMIDGIQDGCFMRLLKKMEA